MLDYLTKLFMFILAVLATGIAAVIAVYAIGVVAVMFTNIKKTIAKTKLDVPKENK